MNVLSSLKRPIDRFAQYRQCFLQIKRLRSATATTNESRIPAHQPEFAKRSNRPVFRQSQRRDQRNAIRPQGSFNKRPEMVSGRHAKHLSITSLRHRLALLQNRNATNPTLKTLARVINQDIRLVQEQAKQWSEVQVARLDETETVDFGTFEELSSCYVDEGMIAIDRRLMRSFLDWLSSQPSTSSEVYSRIRALLQSTDYRFPAEWYPLARKMVRKIIMHVGPTNSGKTHTALTALANARVGIYAGPLRLLAHEVFARFNAGTIGGLNGKPRPCNLLTGEEERYMDDLRTLSSCTVEMLPSHQKYDVAVIDEIQMIADPARGAAWTAALLACEAAELHLCGEESAVDLVKRIAATTGDHVEVRRYERLSPLKVSNDSLDNDLSQIQKGDCVVTFSRNNIFAVKRTIEQKTGLKVAVAYGGLPPEVREEQARSFNSETGYDVMVASDAIGMGLNLKIRRIIFEAVHKFDGKEFLPLAFPQVKQIAGRAGRFGMHVNPSPSAPDIDEPSSITQPSTDRTVGIVTTLDKEDLPALHVAMGKPIRHLARASLVAIPDQLRKMFWVAPPGCTFADILSVSHQIGLSGPNYRIDPENPNLSVASLLDPHKALPIEDRMVLASAPINTRDEVLKAAFNTFIVEHIRKGYFDLQNYAQGSGALHLVKEIVLLAEGKGDEDLAKHMITVNSLTLLESFHRVLSLYLWLSNRMPLTFATPDQARVLKRKTEGAIAYVLGKLAFDRKTTRDLRKPRRAS